MTEELNERLQKMEVSIHELKDMYRKALESIQVYESSELGELFAALAKAQAEMQLAKEDSVNPFFKSNYADLVSVIKSTRPHLNKHGLCVIQRVMPSGDGRTFLHTRLGHASGQWMESKIILISAKADMQGLGGAITYGRRYAYAALVGAIAGETDDDGEIAVGRGEKKVIEKKPISTITQTQAKKLLELITPIPDDKLLDKILEHYKLSKLSDLPQSLYDECTKRVIKSGEMYAIS